MIPGSRKPEAARKRLLADDRSGLVADCRCAPRRTPRRLQAGNASGRDRANTRVGPLSYQFRSVGGVGFEGIRHGRPGHRVQNPCLANSSSAVNSPWLFARATLIALACSSDVIFARRSFAFVRAACVPTGTGRRRSWGVLQAKLSRGCSYTTVSLATIVVVLTR
jgi:hypothetical protein